MANPRCKVQAESWSFEDRASESKEDVRQNPWCWDNLNTLQTWATVMGKKMIKTASKRWTNDQLGIHGYPIDATKWWTKAWTLDKSSIQAPWCENS